MRRRRHLPPPALLEIDEQTFREKYRPIVEPAEGQAIRDPEQVANLMATTLWTVVDTGESETLYALAGCHVVNRLGYVVTKRPWPHRSVVAVYSQGVAQGERQDGRGT